MAIQAARRSDSHPVGRTPLLSLASMRWSLLGLVSLLGACRAEGAEPLRNPTSSGAERAGARTDQGPGPDRSQCPTLLPAEEVADALERGSAKLEESRDGDHYRVEPFTQGIEALRVAAENGSREAMTLYGSTLFGTMFTNQAPVEDEREDYVSSIAFLRIAAKGGDPGASDYMPGLLAEQPVDLEPPLDHVPGQWVRDAFAYADDWIACHGLPR
jgi:TPR repeat protein